MVTEKTGTIQLCVFKIPGLDGHMLALTLPEILAVGSITELLPVPFSPDYVFGLSLWHDRVLTAIDLGGALQGKQANKSNEYGKYRFLIAQTIWGTQHEVIAWPILEGADTHAVLLQDVWLDHDPSLNHNLIYSTLHTVEQQFLLINTTGFLKMRNPAS